MNKIVTFFLFCAFVPLLLFSQQSFTEDEILGKQIPKGGSSNPYKLRSEVYDAFLKMQKKARVEGIEIRIASGFRNFDRQKNIWDRKFKKYTNQGLSSEAASQKIIEYSTYPGTSRHHWGTDIDIIQKVKNTPQSLLVAKNFSEEGAFCRLHEWMQKNAADFGFYLVYTDDEKRTGFSYEPWHYSYRATSFEILKTALELDVYGKTLKKEEIPLDFSYFFTHILGINSLLKP